MNDIRSKLKEIQTLSSQLQIGLHEIEIMIAHHEAIKSFSQETLSDCDFDVVHPLPRKPPKPSNLVKRAVDFSFSTASCDSFHPPIHTIIQTSYKSNKESSETSESQAVVNSSSLALVSEDFATSSGLGTDDCDGIPSTSEHIVQPPHSHPPSLLQPLNTCSTRKPFSNISTTEADCKVVYFQVKLYAVIWAFTLVANKPDTVFWYVDKFAGTKRALKVGEQLVFTGNSAKTVAIDGGSCETSICLDAAMFRMDKNIVHSFGLTENNLVSFEAVPGYVAREYNVHSYDWMNFRNA